MRAEALLGHAAELLRVMLRSGQPPDAVARTYFQRRSYLGSKERRFLAEVTFAALRCLGTLRHCLAEVAPAKAPSSEWLLVCAMGCLGRGLGHAHLTPACAAALRHSLSASEEEFWAEVLLQVGWAGHDAEAWIEALWQSLCRLERGVASLLEQPYGEWDGWQWAEFAAACSMPEWILRRWLENPWLRFQATEVIGMSKALQLPAFPCLRVNTLRASRPWVLQELQRSGIGASPTSFSPDGIRLWERIALHELPLVREGIVELQEEASQLVGYAVAPERGWRLWDACAGAGGKTLHLAALQHDQGEIWASDVDVLRLRALRQRMRRAGVRSVQVLHLPNGMLPSALPRRFDALLVDAPCSGLGTVRRTPTLKWRLTPEALQRHCRRQRGLLEAYAPRVVPGGVLVYATCSLLPEENFGVVQDFLQAHPDWELEPVEPLWRAAGIEVPCLPAEQAPVLLLPSVHGTDGFFIARLRRRLIRGRHG
ncbi:Ribosomal RNA small subunit methyltransferase B [bacterium HR21]|nr:Ribosomal RNA small subunit methyltransferase B [bacterium HR21]